MPVTTSVYIHNPVDYRIVFARCAVLIGASARTRTGDDGGMIFTTTDQGQLAWTWVEYGNDGPPLRTAAVPHRAVRPRLPRARSRLLDRGRLRRRSRRPR